MHDNLVAPRPVRIASNPTLPFNNLRRTPPHNTIRSPVAAMKHLSSSPSDTLAKIQLESHDNAFEGEDEYTRASTRSPMTLPQEALEEFLSILRPSVMPFQSLRNYSASPPRRTNRASFRAMSPFTHPLLSSSSPPASPLASPDHLNDAERSGVRIANIANLEDSHKSSFEFTTHTGSVWRGGILSSPVSRNHTMNPFARRPSHEDIALSLSHRSYPPPSPSSNLVLQLERVPISPTMVPLPPSTTPPLSPCAISDDLKGANRDQV